MSFNFENFLIAFSLKKFFNSSKKNLNYENEMLVIFFVFLEEKKLFLTIR